MKQRNGLNLIFLRNDERLFQVVGKENRQPDTSTKTFKQFLYKVFRLNLFFN